MKTFKSFFNGSLKAILAAAVVTPMMTSCLGDGENTYGYNYGTTDYVYANTPSVLIAFQISGATWTLAKTETAAWYDFGLSTGSGPFAGYVPVSFSYNNTGSARSSYYKVTSSDGTTFNGAIYQGATRGDGSLGSAPLVRRITGTDGTVMSFTYTSDYQLPATMIATKNGSTLYSYVFSYSTADTTLYIRNTQLNTVLSGKYNTAWAPSGTMLSANDTVTWSYSGNSIGASTRFTVERRQADGVTSSISSVNSGLSDIDTEIVHRSIIINDCNSAGTEFSKTMSVTLGASSTEYVSNQNQNIDVNQLVFGFDHCNPYMLLGYYRWMRCGYVYKSLASATSSDSSSYTIETTLNSDKSVSTMTVTDVDGNAITYTFEY